MRQVKEGRSQKLLASTIRRISSDNAAAGHQANSWKKNNKKKKQEVNDVAHGRNYINII